MISTWNMQVTDKAINQMAIQQQIRELQEFMDSLDLNVPEQRKAYRKAEAERDSLYDLLGW